MRHCTRLVAAQECSSDVPMTKSLQKEREDTIEETTAPINTMNNPNPVEKCPVPNDVEAGNFTGKAKN